jgi:hypothetical protein
LYWPQQSFSQPRVFHLLQPNNLRERKKVKKTKGGEPPSVTLIPYLAENNALLVPCTKVLISKRKHRSVKVGFIDHSKTEGSVVVDVVLVVERVSVDLKSQME